MESQKITFCEAVASKRRYEDACGVAHGLDLIGERWALLVLRELMLGPKRFSDLRADLPGLSANILTQRLEGLEASGLLTRKRLPPPANTQVYELTPWGYEAEQIILSLGRWACRSPAQDHSLPVSNVSILLSFRAMFVRERAGELDARIGFRFGAESFIVRIAAGELTASRDSLEKADVIFTGTASAVAAAVYGGQPLEALAQAGALTVEGDRDLAKRFVSLFSLPQKARADGR